MKIITYTFCLAVLFISCKHYTKVDVSEIDVKIEIKRFDRDLFSIDINNIKAAIPGLKEKYGKFFTLYNYRVIKIGGTENPAYPDYLKSFLSDYTMSEVYKKCQQIFPDVDELNKKLTEAFKYYKYYFPERAVPNVYTFISGFNQSIVIADSILGIGVDKYLGEDNEYYKLLALPNYMRYKMHKEKITSDCISSWALTEFEPNDSANNVLSKMLYQGKIMYFTDLMLPWHPDTLKLGFTTNQLLWCKKNEKNMWNYLVENKHLYETNYIVINKYINDAPFTKFFTQESPGRAIVWMGREIIRSYMEHNPGVSLPELMEENDFQKILTLAKYKP